MRCFPIVLLACLSVAVPAQIQEPAPDPLLDAGHCLASAQQDWLGLNQTYASQLELGYIADSKTVPGQDLLNIVEYTTRTHTDGRVFTFLAKGKDPHRVLRLQFRTAFRQSDDGSRQLELVNPPLGGVGTQDQILSAIRQVGFHTYSIPVGDLRTRSASVQCESEPDVE
jgi:hypothetical protein